MKESWVSLIIILICIAVIVLCAFNALTYAKIANEKKTVGDVTPTGARVLMVINIILCVVFFIPVIVYGMRFYYSALKGRVFSWVNLLIILGIIASIILCAFNAVTYAKIANENKTVGDVTPGGARALMVINILLCIIFLVPLFYYSYKMYNCKDMPAPASLLTKRDLGTNLMSREEDNVVERLGNIAEYKAMIADRTGDIPDIQAAITAESDYIEAQEAQEEFQTMEPSEKFQGQKRIIDFLRLNDIKTIDDSDAVYDTVCHPRNPLRSRKCDL